MYIGFYNTRKVCASLISSAQAQTRVVAVPVYILFSGLCRRRRRRGVLAHTKDLPPSASTSASPSPFPLCPPSPGPPAAHCAKCWDRGRGRLDIMDGGRTDVVASPAAHAGPSRLSRSLSSARNVVSFPACVLRMSERGPKMAATS